MPGRPPLPLPFYYGWVIVALAFWTMAFTITARFSFAIYQVPLIAEFGWGRGALGGAYALMLAAYALFCPFVGSLFDRRGPRSVVPWGSALVGTGLTLSFFVSSLWHVYLFTGLFLGLGAAMSGFAVNSAMMPRWFQRGRGTATGIALSGSGIGILLLVPAIERLIAGVYRPWIVGHEVDGIPSHAACSSRPSFSARTWAGVRQPWRSMSHCSL